MDSPPATTACGWCRRQGMENVHLIRSGDWFAFSSWPGYRFQWVDIPAVRFNSMMLSKYIGPLAVCTSINTGK